MEKHAAGAAEGMKVVGLDHVYLAVRDMARSESFYDRVMEVLGFRKGDKAIAGERHAHYFTPSLQISIRPARTDAEHDPYRAGLHHLCLQAADVASVDELHRRLATVGVQATPPRRYPEYNPDYYATFFEDPDGIRFELVARTPYRETLARRWHEFQTFLNPLQDLTTREAVPPERGGDK